MTAIIVLGGHRTGTSVTARIIHDLGFPAAPSSERLLWPRPGHEQDNPDGYWEDVAFVRLHRRMLGEHILALGGWRNPRRDDAVIARLRPRYLKLLRERAAHAENWCLKDPRLCLLGDVLFESLDQLRIDFRIVTTVRPVSVVVASLMRRGMSEPDALRLAETFEVSRLAICELARSQSRVCLELSLQSQRPISGVQAEISRHLGLRRSIHH
jgi:hypothetical protein